MKRLHIKISKEDKSGLYLTVILHVGLVIVLLVSQIATAVNSENTYVLDFSQAEEQERLEQEEEFRQDISDRIDDLLAAASAVDSRSGWQEEIRNIAVDASSAHLEDDRNTDAEQLYRDVERLARELESGAYAPEPENPEDYAALPDHRSEETDADKPVYTGPSVVSYSLDGRKAVNLSVPAYRCMGAGDVTVRITVNPSGVVDAVEIMEDFSSSDHCLREFAKRAARLSRFTASATAPKRQYGEIVYRFIAQ